MAADGGVLVITGLVFVGALVFGVWQRGREGEALAEAARRLGVDYTPESGFFGAARRTFDGHLDRIPFRVEAYTKRAGKNSHRRIRISTLGTPYAISLRKQGFLDDAWQAVAGEDLQLGDEEFDRLVVVKGDPLVARALLDARTRRAVAELLTDLGASVHEGSVVLDVARTVTDASWVVERVTRLAGLVRDLREAEAHLDDRLVDLVREDPAPGIRRAAFKDLKGRRPERLTPLLDTLVRDRDPGVRALAADLAGDLPTLRRLFAQTEDEEALVYAAMAVVRHRDGGAESALLTHAAHPNATVRVAVADALGAVGTVRAVETLLPLTRGLLVDGAAKAAATAAIAAIQSRLGQVEAGRLSVVEDTLAGAVSVAAQVGAVSVVKPGT